MYSKEYTYIHKAKSRRLRKSQAVNSNVLGNFIITYTSVCLCLQIKQIILMLSSSVVTVYKHNKPDPTPFLSFWKTASYCYDYDNGCYPVRLFIVQCSSLLTNCPCFQFSLLQWPPPLSLGPVLKNKTPTEHKLHSYVGLKTIYHV